MNFKKFLITGMFALGVGFAGQYVSGPPTNRSPTELPAHIMTPEKTLNRAVYQAFRAYYHERDVVKKYIHVREERLKKVGYEPANFKDLMNPNLKDKRGRPVKHTTLGVLDDEFKFLSEVEYFGAQLLNKKNKYRYDPTWQSLVDTLKNLKATDCTISLLEDLTAWGYDKRLLSAYKDTNFTVTEFPWVSAMDFRREGYVPLLFIADTTSKKRYHNGSRYGGKAKSLLHNVQNDDYYTSPTYFYLTKHFRDSVGGVFGFDMDTTLPAVEYIISNEGLEDSIVKELLTTEKGIFAAHDNYHYYFLADGSRLLERKWGENPLLSNTMRMTNLYDRLLMDEKEDDKIHNGVLWVLQEHMEKYDLQAYATRQEELLNNEQADVGYNALHRFPFLIDTFK